MRTSLRLALAGLALILLLGAAAWWYLFGPNPVSAAELVPADTVAFLTIPNAAKLTVGYETSHLKKVIDAPNMQPVIDAIVNFIGEKNRALILAFLPNLSGQSFIAVTHFDPDNVARIGLVAGMKPKPGMGNFDAFVEKLKATYPDAVRQGTTGAGQVAGLDYQWIQGPGAPDKICVAKINGWIVTAWGEATLQDWVERLQKKSSAPSLADNPDYQKSLKRVGDDPMALVYLDYHAIVGVLQKQLAKTNAPSAGYLAEKLGGVGAFTVGTRFEHGEIVDRFSCLMPRQAQVAAGMIMTPCPFETLKFTSPDTRFYFGTSLNWAQYWKNLQEQAAQSAPINPLGASLLTSLQTWAQSRGLDVQRNIVEALGPEFSAQVEWAAETPYPEAGLFVKVAKPDDFKPTIQAIVETVRATYAASAVINEINANGHNFATLKFVNPIPISPTITEDGDYFGIFLTENQAVRAFQRDETVGLLHNADFSRQVGDKRSGASQIVFLDSPQLLDRAYRTAQPYLSLAAMFNKELAALLKDKNLPPDLGWLAPIGPWSFVVSPDDEGMKAYSVSGIGNQGILLAFTAGGTAGIMQSWGHSFSPSLGTAPNPTAPPPGNPMPATPANPPLQPGASASVAPDTATNSVPPLSSAPAPATNSNPDVTSPTPTPDPAKTQ